MEIHDKCSLHEVDSDETQILMYQTPSFSVPLLFRFILTAAAGCAAWVSKLHSLLGLTTTYSLVCCLKNASPFPHPDLVFVLFETVIIPFFFYTIRNHMMKRLINGSKVKL